MCHSSRSGQLAQSHLKNRFVLLISIVLMLGGLSGVGQEVNNDHIDTSQKTRTSKKPYHKISIGVGLSVAAPAITAASSLTVGNELLGYISYGARGIRNTTRGVVVRYDKSFTVDRKYTSNFGVKPCLMGAINFNRSTIQNESFFLFNSDIYYQVGRHRSVSGGFGLDMHFFYMKSRIGIRTMCVFSEVIDEFGIERKSGYGYSEFAEVIDSRAHVPCQLNIKFTAMIGRRNHFSGPKV